MRNFIIGLFIGFIVGGTVVAYANVAVLYGNDNVEKGTQSNPLYVRGI